MVSPPIEATEPVERCPRRSRHYSLKWDHKLAGIFTDRAIELRGLLTSVILAMCDRLRDYRYPQRQLIHSAV